MRDGRRIVYQDKACNLFAVESPIRQACIKIVDCNLFNGAILLCIVANCVFLAMDDGSGAQVQVDEGAFSSAV